MKSLLVATDFSETSLAAEDFAARLAVRLQAHVYLVHSYLPAYPVTDPMVMVPLVEEGWEETYQKEAENRLQQRAEGFRKHGIPCDTLVQIGPLTDVVLAVLQETAAECVIVGRTNDDSWMTELLGTQATHLFENVSVPLLMVPVPVRQGEIGRVVYATSTEFDETEALEKVFVLARALSVPVEIVKISDAGGPAQQVPDSIRTRFPDQAYTFQQVEAPALAEGLEAYAHQGAAPLLVMGAHHRNVITELLHPSQSRQMLLHGQLPVLIYHLQEK